MQKKDVVTTSEHRCKTLDEKSQKVVGYTVTYRLDGKDGTLAEVAIDDPGSI